MAGRGRGGRGRGRAAMSFNVEQLGFSVGEALPGPVLQPPPVYPKMENRPLPLQGGVEGEYMLALKRDFVEFLRDSPAYVMPAAAKPEIERYSDRYQKALINKSHGELKLPWSYFPPEIRPQTKATGKRKHKDTATKKAAKKTVDINSRLEELMKKEEQQSDNEGEGEEAEGKEEEEEKEGEGEGVVDDIEEEDQDEEMDQGTDYINNYFDNGEGYLDEEDDNLDDGPVY